MKKTIVAVAILAVGVVTMNGRGMAYKVVNEHYIEAPCGEGIYSERGKYFDIVGDVVVRPFDKCQCK